MILILINMEMMVVLLGLIHTQDFHSQMVNGVKMLFFLELIIVLPCKLIIKANHPINFAISRRIVWLGLHYNGRKSFLFANATKMYQFKTKDSELKPYLLCLGNILKDFTMDNMEKTGFICILLLILISLILTTF